METANIKIILDRRAALVLFDWLADRAEEKDVAVKVALWQLEAAFEPALVEILEPDYKAKVEKASNELREMHSEE